MDHSLLAYDEYDTVEGEVGVTSEDSMVNWSQSARPWWHGLKATGCEVGLLGY